MFIARNGGFRIEGGGGGEKNNMRHEISPPFRSALFYGRAQYLSSFNGPSCFVVISEPAPEEIPGELLTDLGVLWINFWKRLTGYIVEQLAVESKSDLTGVFLRGLNVLFQ